MTYKDLLNTWGEDLDREDLSFEDELDYVNDWYELAQSLTTIPFNPNYSEYEKYRGQDFKIVGIVSYVNDDIELEQLPMWKIQMPNGDILWANCDEIFDIN